ncbi:MAG: glycosyltransferase family 4 protein [Alphaproteobacteria bacterium]|nr:glycosyltransferase family 4 protein [Alphaproteobacteria bacterium]
MNKKTLFINRVFPPLNGATGRILIEMKEELELLGQDIEVMHDSKPMSRLKSLAYLFFKTLFISNKKYKQAVIMTDPPFILLLAPILKLKGIKVIHWGMDIYPELFEVFNIKIFNKKFLFSLNKFLLKFVDEFVVIGRDMKNHFANNYNIKRENIHVIYNWADRIVKPMNIEKKNFTVMYSGNWGLAYDFSKILDIADSLQSEKSIVFQLIGGGSQKEKVVKEIEGRGIKNIEVSNYKPMSQYVESINSADIHLVSVNPKTKGLMVPCKTYSCLAAGIPCLFCGDQESEIAQLINEYDCGMASDDIKIISKEIISLYKDSELRKAKGDNALIINQKYGLEKAAKKFNKVLNNVQ